MVLDFKKDLTKNPINPYDQHTSNSVFVKNFKSNCEANKSYESLNYQATQSNTNKYSTNTVSYNNYQNTEQHKEINGNSRGNNNSTINVNDMGQIGNYRSGNESNKDQEDHAFFDEPSFISKITYKED